MEQTPMTTPARKRAVSRIQWQTKTTALVVRWSERANVGRAYYDRAKVCALRGDVSGTVLAYETAVMFAPDFAEAFSNLGNLYLQNGRCEEALRAYAKAIRAKPDLAPVYCNLATVLIDLQRCEEAIAASEAALRLAPDLYEAHANLCQAYRRCGRVREALAPALRAAALRPDLAAYLDLGATAHELDAFDIALDAYRRALELDATCAEAHCNLGSVYHSTRSYCEAIAAGEAAIALRPDFALAHCNLAAAYLATGQYDEAIAAGEAAIALRPDFALAHCNLGAAYHATGRYAEAIAAGEAAIVLRPDLALAHCNLGSSLLICGDFVRGWDEYVWLWRVPARRTLPHLDRVPLWHGEAFAGLQLLITADEGFGDAIQLVRYLPAIRARGGRVILEVGAALFPLFADIAGADQLRVLSDFAILADDVDLQVPLSGLPRALATDLSSIPAPIPYLGAQPERVEHWRPRLVSSARLRVGIVWAGNPDHANDRRRSVHLEDFAVLGGIDGIAWFGLQKGRDEQRGPCGSFTLDPLGEEIGDFADTAAILAHLDLVIAVDTAIVHLAGAMGMTIWTLLPFVPDWRWLLGRPDSPWYPTMRLFRQPAPGDWASVFAEVARELRSFKLSRANVPRESHDLDCSVR